MRCEGFENPQGRARLERREAFSFAPRWSLSSSAIILIASLFVFVVRSSFLPLFVAPLITTPFSHTYRSLSLGSVQGNLCKHLLQLSQSPELTILSLTLRVVFNLFNSMKDHLKVQLEVFLTSVHLRILSPNLHKSNNYSPEQRELALESLLEFCQEPALMQDLYTNYDCDFQCTNLFETICSTLSVQAKPLPDSQQQSLNALNRLALNGILAVIDSICT